MKVKAIMRKMTNAKVDFISLVDRGANRIPFRTIKSEGDNMLDLTQLRRVFKGDAPAQAKPTSMGFAAILRGGKPAPKTVAKSAPVQSVAKHVETNRVNPVVTPSASRQPEQQQIAPNQAQPAASAPRRAANNPKVPAKPSRDTVTLKELRGEIDNALARRKKEDEQEQFVSVTSTPS